MQPHVSVVRTHGSVSCARGPAVLAVLALVLTLHPAGHAGVVTSHGAIGTGFLRGVGIIEINDLVPVEIDVVAAERRRFSGAFEVGERTFEAEGTVAAGSRPQGGRVLTDADWNEASIVGRGDGRVVVHGQLGVVAEGAVVLDGGIRFPGKGRDTGSRGRVVLLRAFDVDPDNPPPEGVAGTYEGSASSSLGASGEASLELGSREEAASLRCVVHLPIVEFDVIAMNDFTGECSISGDDRVVGVLIGPLEGGAAAVVLDGRYVRPPPPEDDVGVAPRRARIEADYGVWYPDGTRDSGTLVVPDSGTIVD